LIELLVVVAIISLLSSVVLASLNSARAKARDARRLEDMHQLKLVLQIYYDSHGDYPGSGSDYYTSSSEGTPYDWDILEGLVGQKLPTDPKGPVPASGAPESPYYQFWRAWGQGTSGPNNCYGRPILRIYGGIETRPQIHECDGLYGENNDNSYFLL
ncbi:MAG: hypothetical protein UT09_C0032G0012, partial [Parcubacteria group bacterium GW2011_GWF2_38_8]